MYLHGTTNIPYVVWSYPKKLTSPDRNETTMATTETGVSGEWPLSFHWEAHGDANHVAAVASVTHIMQFCNFVAAGTARGGHNTSVAFVFLAFLVLLWELCVVHWFLLPTFFPPTGFPNTSPNILKLPPGHFSFYYVISLKKSVLNGFVHWGEKAYVHLSTNLRIPCTFLILCPFSSNRFHTSTGK